MNEGVTIFSVSSLSANTLINLLTEGVIVALSFLLLVPCLVIFVECVLAVFPKRQMQEPIKAFVRPSVAVLVPAHNEATGIGSTLNKLLPQLIAQDRLIVIADNCSDETAAIARSSGATVIERHDPVRRGKGYALDFGLQFLASTPPDVVVVVDADCTVAAGAIEKIAHLAIVESRPIQAVYLLSQPTNPNPKDAVSALAFTVKNLVRPLGLDRLGLPCLLTGTGMAFPWSVIRKVSLASGDIVEDMKLALDLAIVGYPPMLCSDAKVMGALPQQEQATKSQRTRWEHGHLRTLVTQVPPLLKESVRQKRFDLFAIALDLCVPPLSLLVMLWAALTGTALIYYCLLNAALTVLVLPIADGLLIFSAVMAAWVKFARDSLPLKTLLSVPLYVLWKVPLYLAFLVKPQTKWVRTERDISSSKL